MFSSTGFPYLLLFVDGHGFIRPSSTVNTSPSRHSLVLFSSSSTTTTGCRRRKTKEIDGDLCRNLSVFYYGHCLPVFLPFRYSSLRLTSLPRCVQHLGRCGRLLSEQMRTRVLREVSPSAVVVRGGGV